MSEVNFDPQAREGVDTQDALQDAVDKDLEIKPPPAVSFTTIELNLTGRAGAPDNRLQDAVNARLAYEKEKQDKSAADAQEEHRKRMERYREDQYQTFRQAYLRSGGDDIDTQVRAAYHRHVERRAAEELAAREPAPKQRRPFTL